MIRVLLRWPILRIAESYAGQIALCSDGEGSPLSGRISRRSRWRDLAVALQQAGNMPIVSLRYRLASADGMPRIGPS